jgi:alpha-tubulin suppressor-like RCC1 family protein
MGAPPSQTPTMMGVPFTASNNTLPDFVQLAWGAPTVQPGPSSNYTVVAINESGASTQSSSDPGSRGASPISAYEVELPSTSGTVEWRNVGPELTWNDETAEPGLVRPNDVDASDAVYEQWVRLSAQAAQRQAGPSRNYRVRALIGTAPGAPSSQVTGARGTGAPTYRWERRASAGFWETITGAVGLNAIDSAGAITPNTTDYRVVVSAQGTTSVSSDSDEGSRSEQLTIDELHAGDAFTCALYDNNSVRCWGLNVSGQAGVPGQNAIGDAFSDFPVEALALGEKVEALAVGNEHACAIVENQVLCWGNGADGRLGNGSTNSVGLTSGSMPPTPVPLPGKAQAIALGADFSCALLDDDHVYCWGDNSDGQLGVPTMQDIGDDTRDTYLPVSVLGGRLGLEPIVMDADAIFAGPSTACAISSAGPVVCWGNKASGMVCDGSNRESAAPQVLAWSAVDIEIGDNSLCMLNSSGQVGCCGSSTVGQGGVGTGTNWGSSSGQNSPRIVSSVGRVRGITGGLYHYCALLDSGVSCWGRAAGGALGNGSSTQNIGDQSTDLPIPSLDFWSSPRIVEAGGQHTCVVSATNTLSCFGRGSFGRLGNGLGSDIGDGPGEMPPAPSVIR